MRSGVKRSSAVAAEHMRIERVGAVSASTISRWSSTMIPVTPSSSTSGTEPRRVATTGVPQASDSIITSPNGSSQSIGKIVARARWSSSTLSAWLDLADVLDPVAEVRAVRSASK